MLNAVAFLFEISVGDLNDPEVLHRVGALEPYAVVVQAEYWRLFTALFLHGGFTHLLFNIFALYILGPPLERSIGTHPIYRVLSDFRACFQRGRCGFDDTRFVEVGSSSARRVVSWGSSVPRRAS